MEVLGVSEGCSRESRRDTFQHHRHICPCSQPCRLCSALRVVRLSARLKAVAPSLNANPHATFMLEPLVAAVDGKAWRGLAPWLDDVVSKCETCPRLCFLATASVAHSLHNSVAARLIPVIAAEAHKEYVYQRPSWFCRFCLSAHECSTWRLVIAGALQGLRALPHRRPLRVHSLAPRRWSISLRQRVRLTAAERT